MQATYTNISNKNLINAWVKLDMALNKSEQDEEHDNNELLYGSTKKLVSSKIRPMTAGSSGRLLINAGSKSLLKHKESSFATLEKFDNLGSTITKRQSSPFHGLNISNNYQSLEKQIPLLTLPRSTKSANNLNSKRPQSACVTAFSPKMAYLEERTQIHSLYIHEIVSIYEAKCLDNKNDYNVNQVQHFIDKFKRNSKHRVFFLEDQSLGKNSAKVIANILRHNNHFTRLNLGKNCIGDEGAIAIANVLKNNHTIIHVDLSSNDISYEGCSEIIEMLGINKTIISLKLNSSDGLNRNRLDSRGVKRCTEIFQNNHVLQFLDFCSSSIGLEGAQSVVKGLLNNQSLLILDISALETGPNLVNTLCKILPTTEIVKLNLSNNKLNDQGIQTLSTIFYNIPGKKTNIDELDISSNNITCIGASKFFEALCKNRTLKKLHMNNNPLEGKGITSLVNTLWDNQILSYLSLVNCRLEIDASEAISSGLVRNTGIDSLILSKNSLKDEGAKLIAQSLQTNQKIKILEIASCRIRDDGGKALAEVVRNCKSLMHLNLRDNSLFDGAGIALVEASRCNKALQKLELEFNPIPYKYIIDIQKCINSNKICDNKSRTQLYEKEIIEMKDFEKTKYNLHEEAITLEDKHKQVDSELKVLRQEFAVLKEKEREKYDELDSKFNEVMDEIRKADRQRDRLDEDMRRFRIESEVDAQYAQRTLSTLNNEISQLIGDIKIQKEKLLASKNNAILQVDKLKKELAEESKRLQKAESETKSTEYQVQKMKEEREKLLKKHLEAEETKVQNGDSKENDEKGKGRSGASLGKKNTTFPAKKESNNNNNNANTEGNVEPATGEATKKPKRNGSAKKKGSSSSKPSSKPNVKAGPKQ